MAPIFIAMAMHPQRNHKEVTSRPLCTRVCISGFSTGAGGFYSVNGPAARSGNNRPAEGHAAFLPHPFFSRLGQACLGSIWETAAGAIGLLCCATPWPASCCRCLQPRRATPGTGRPICWRSTSARGSARDAGSRTISIVASAVERQGRPLVHITVEDAGPGIAPDVMSRLFVAFVTTKARGKATGWACAHLQANRRGDGR